MNAHTEETEHTPHHYAEREEQQEPEQHEPGQEGQATYFTDLPDFVENYLTVVFEQELGQTRTWCPRWWEHDGAAMRLHALWMSWEQLRVQEPTLGMAMWLASYADPIMNVLLSPTGPFNRCSVERGHSEHRPHENGLLPYEAAPVDLFHRT